MCVLSPKKARLLHSSLCSALQTAFINHSHIENKPEGLHNKSEIEINLDIRTVSGYCMSACNVFAWCMFRHLILHVYKLQD